MDCANFYEPERSGRFSVTFLNRRALTVDQIKELFSKYGTVAGVNCAGDLKGHRFVKFFSEADVIRCVKDLENHEFIKLLPRKSRDDQRHANSKQTPNGLKNNRMTRDKDQFHSKKSETDDNSSEHSESGKSRKSFHSFSKGKQDQNILDDDCRSVSSRHSADNSTMTDQMFIPQSARLRDSLSMLTEITQKRGIMADTFKVDMDKDNKARYTAHENEMPNLVNSEGFKAERPPVLNNSGQDKMKDEKTDIVTAQDVVVANIDPNFGVFYILHLLEKYKPIAASLIKTVPKTSIRYCHVYFETFEQALAVERKFDNYTLCESPSKKSNNNMLIVLRSNMLMKEAALS